MTSFLAMVANDIRILHRSGYIVVSILIISLFAFGASRLVIPPVGAVADVMAALVIVLAVMSPFLTVGILLLSERSEGVLISMGVTPAPLWQSLLSRMIVIAALSIAEMFVLFFAAFGTSVDAGLLLAGLLSISLVSILFGVFAVAPHSALYAYILPMVGWVLFLSAPAFAAFADVDARWTAWHPMAPAQQLLAGAFGAQGGLPMIYGAAGSIVWIALASLIAARGLAQMQRAEGEG
ncbi:MAG: hypothetical protein AAGD92_00875 [Pseudomonadota bacterium]